MEALENLSPKEKKIIEMRQGLIDGITRTLEEVGKELGITRESVRRIEWEAQEKLRNSKLKEFNPN